MKTDDAFRVLVVGVLSNVIPGDRMSYQTTAGAENLKDAQRPWALVSSCRWDSGSPQPDKLPLGWLFPQSHGH